MRKKVILEHKVGQWKQRRMDWVNEELAVVGLKLRCPLQSNNGYTVYEEDWEVIDIMETALQPADSECRWWEAMPATTKKKRT